MACENPKRRVIIGNDVWIGDRAYIMSGCCIGSGAVIAANAVVTKDVEPYTIVAGVPAREIKKRFPQSITSELLESRWWMRHPVELVNAFSVNKIGDISSLL